MSIYFVLFNSYLSQGLELVQEAFSADSCFTSFGTAPSVKVRSTEIAFSASHSLRLSPCLKTSDSDR